MLHFLLIVIACIVIYQLAPRLFKILAYGIPALTAGILVLAGIIALANDHKEATNVVGGLLMLSALTYCAVRSFRNWRNRVEASRWMDHDAAMARLDAEIAADRGGYRTIDV